MHALVTCKAANKEWQLLSLASAAQQMRNSDLLGELMMLQKKLSKADLELMVSMWWVIWYARNKFVFERVKLDPGVQLTRAETVNKAFRRTKYPEVLNLEKMQKDTQTFWNPPP